MTKHRTKCVLCNNDTKNLFNLNMPIFMGVNKSNSNEIISKMNFDFCENCGEVQIRELIDLELLYMNNHNEDVVGETWINHYKFFSEFISDEIKNKKILEISDPSAKIAKISKDFKKWIILEPNFKEQNLNNLEFIKTFFEEFETNEKYDVIVHSHLLEHIHEPNNFFKKCYELLSENGVMVISIPNMEYLLTQEVSPVNFLHFEHTYYINKEVLNYLANKNGFSMYQTENYKNHSLFFKLKKEKKLEILPKQEIKNILFNNFEKKLNSIQTINEKVSQLKNCEIFLFGSHVTSQFCLQNGLNEKGISGLLDNSESKQNHKLYGSSLLTYSPNYIKDKSVVVICSHLGIYEKEIVEQLKEINSNVIII